MWSKLSPGSPVAGFVYLAELDINEAAKTSSSIRSTWIMNTAVWMTCARTGVIWRGCGCTGSCFQRGRTQEFNSAQRRWIITWKQQVEQYLSWKQLLVCNRYVLISHFKKSSHKMETNHHLVKHNQLYNFLKYPRSVFRFGYRWRDWCWN